MKKAFTIILVALMVVLTAGFASAAACMISPGLNYPLLPDSDCDGWIDMDDNCPFITNPLQQDSDENGLGNACDIYYEAIGTNPADFVFNGRTFETVVTLKNNREYNLRNVRVNVFIPDLGLESVQYTDNLDVCESTSLEFMLRAPICAPEAEYPVFVETTFMNHMGIQEKTVGVTSIRVIPDEYCKMVLSGNGELGNTYVDVMEIKDVYKGMEAVYPIKISNREFENKEYIISVTGLSGWGMSRLTPNSLIIVPAGADRIADLYISARQDVPPGERAFVVTVQSGEEFQRFLLIANVKEAPVEDRSVFFIFGMKMIFITLLVALIIMLIAVAVAKTSAKAKSKAQHEKYYY